MTEYVQRIAKIERTMLGYEDHGILTICLHCDYGGSGQGVGLHFLKDEATDRWVRGVLSACGVREWEKVAGRTIHVLFDEDDFNAIPVGIEPLPTEPGERFLFKENADD